MQWQDIIKTRENTLNWLPTVPDQTIIEQILDEIHEHCPSKQLRVPYYIDALNWNEHNSMPVVYNYILQNKTQLQDSISEWCQNENLVGTQKRSFRENLGYLISALANDAKYNSNKYSYRLFQNWYRNNITTIAPLNTTQVLTYLKHSLKTLFSEPQFDSAVVDFFHTRLDNCMKIAQQGPSADVVLLPGVGNARFDIFCTTYTQLTRLPNDRMNPQVLAPWLLVFSTRNLENGAASEQRDSDAYRRFVKNEIGLAAMFAVLSAVDKGLSTGFCACIQEKKDVIQHLGHDYNEDPLLYVGLGYKNPDPYWLNPATHTTRRIYPKQDQKPPKNQYITLRTI